VSDENTLRLGRDGIASISGCPDSGCGGSSSIDRGRDVGNRRRFRNMNGGSTTIGTTTVGTTSLEGRTVSQGSLFEVSVGVWFVIKTTVDGEDHTSTAMAVGGSTSLATVNPDGGGIMDIHGEGGEVSGLVCLNRDKARVDTAGHGGTWGSERRLGDSVVLGVEVENNLVTGCGTDCGRLELELAIRTDKDIMNSSRYKGQ
jgi:hypothetical protein